MTASYTQLEQALLANLTASGFEGPCFWSTCLTGGLITNRNVGPIVASLVRKGVLKANWSSDPSERTVTLL